mgnify:CR=1 FL=1
MHFAYSATQTEIQSAVMELCQRFGAAYWRDCDEKKNYPTAFVQAMAEAGWLAALIPGPQAHFKGGYALTRDKGVNIVEAKYLADAPRFLHYIRSTANRYRQLGPLLQLVDEIGGTTPVTGFAYGRM